MPRRLSDEVNELRIKDNISGSEIVFSYRMPTTSERAAYANESYRRKGSKIENRVVEARQKFGKKILVGVRDGDFEVKLEDGTYAPLSSTPGPHYQADWKDTVARHAGELLELLAARVFDGSASLETDAPEEEAGGVEAAASGEDAEKN